MRSKFNYTGLVLISIPGIVGGMMFAGSAHYLNIGEYNIYTIILLPLISLILMVVSTYCAYLSGWDD